MNILAESEKGKVNENIDCKAEGDAIKIGLNNKYISDAISKIKEDFLRIKIENNTRPIIIEKIDGDDYKSIIFPVRIM
jgi:DNA polymerase III sliding clamp (beta) subunit (PCNA family)